MLILASILLTFITALLILGIGKTQLKRGFLWILITLNSLIAWGLFLLSLNQIPITIPIVDWKPQILFSESLLIIVDDISWPFAAAIITLILSIFLVEVININKPNLWNWALIPIFGGCVLFAVISGNLLTMAISWAILDTTISIYLILRESGRGKSESAVISFSIRIVSLVMLIFAILQVNKFGEPVQFNEIPAEVSVFFFIAAGFRLIVLPLSLAFLHKSLMDSSLGTMLCVGTSAASIVLLVRISHENFTGNWLLFLVLGLTITLILSVLFFIQKSNIRDRKFYWIVGLSVFILASTTLGLPVASSVWGLVMFYSGALLFLYTNSQQKWLAILFFGLVGFSSIPLTPAWEGVSLFIALPWGLKGIYLIALAFLLVGYLPFFDHTDHSYKELDRWMVPIRILGMVVLLITLYGLTYLQWILGSPKDSLLFPGWWIGFMPFGIAVLILFLKPRSWFTFTITPYFKAIFSWVYQILYRGYKLFNRALILFTNILEGDGSVLWALLILILLTLSISILNKGDSFDL